MPSKARPTSDEMAEIFARELYVFNADPDDQKVRNRRRRWLAGQSLPTQDHYRHRAHRLLASLAKSGIVLAARPSNTEEATTT